ncbi:MAG: AsmA family protein, partial [Rhodomicrobium sp.]|nr:AsmA family protein [Rhodomicrobium sp.]
MRLKAPFFGILLALAGFLLPSIVFVAVLPSLINAEPVKKRLIDELRSWTGSDIHIAGPVSIDNFFSLTVNLRNVEFKGFEGVAKFKSLKAGEIVARIAWTNLLIGRFDFDKIKIYDATAHLGRISEGELVGALQKTLIGPHKVPFSAFVIDDCIVKAETDGGAERTLMQVRKTVAEYRPSDGRISLSGLLTWRDEPVFVDALTFAAPAGGPAESMPLQLDINGRLLTANFKGEANFIGSWAASGALKAKTPDTLALATWLGIEDGPALPLRGEITGALELTGDSIGLQSAAIALDGQQAYGDLILARAAKAPKIEGSLAFESLDLRRLWGLASGPAPSSANEQAFWTGLLRRAALDLRLSAAEMRWDGLTMKDAALTVSGNSGLLAADLADLALFGGSIIGHIQLDLRAEPAKLRVRITGDNLEAAELLAAGAKGDWLYGKADVNMEGEAAGSTAE